jgi:hypothetical protein
LQLPNVPRKNFLAHRAPCLGRFNLLFGINYFVPAERITGQLFSIEVGAPVFQSLEGPQLGLDWTLIAGWNLIF